MAVIYEVLKPCDVVTEEARPGKPPVRRRFALHEGNVRAFDERVEAVQVPESAERHKTVPAREYLRQVDESTFKREGVIKRLPSGSLHIKPKG